MEKLNEEKLKIRRRKRIFRKKKNFNWKSYNK